MNFAIISLNSVMNIYKERPKRFYERMQGKSCNEVSQEKSNKN